MEIDPSVKEELNNYFHEDILRTQELTGLNLQSWLK